MRSYRLIQQVGLTIGVPSLSDTASDWERLQRALLPLLDGRPLSASLASLRDLGPALRRGDWQVTATLADAGDAWRLIRVDPAQSSSPALGLAVDLGTTTVVAELVETGTGNVLASRMAYNAQRQFGVDVTARMMHSEKPGGLTGLRQAILDTLNELVAALCSETERKANALARRASRAHPVHRKQLTGRRTCSAALAPELAARIGDRFFDHLPGING